MAQPFALRSTILDEPAPEAFRADLAIKLTCPNCNALEVNLIEEFGSGDLVCGDCGLVLGDKIVDTRSEWRTFANDEGDDPSRVGGPVDPLLSVAEQFTTTISFKDGNSGEAKVLQMAAARVTKNSSNGTRDLGKAFTQISDMCAIVSLPKLVVDTCKQLFKRVDEEKVLKKKPIEAVIAACIFIACRQAGVERTIKEIMQLTNVDKKTLATCFKLIGRIFDTRLSSAVAPSDTSDSSRVARLCNQLGLSKVLLNASVYTATKVKSLGLLDGRDPGTVAGACILFATSLFGQRVEMRKIEEVVGMTGGTITQSFRLMIPKRDAIANPNWFLPSTSTSKNVASASSSERADWSHLEGEINRLNKGKKGDVEREGSVASSRNSTPGL